MTEKKVDRVIDQIQYILKDTDWSMKLPNTELPVTLIEAKAKLFGALSKFSLIKAAIKNTSGDTK